VLTLHDAILLALPSERQGISDILSRLRHWTARHAADRNHYGVAFFQGRHRSAIARDAVGLMLSTAPPTSDFHRPFRKIGASRFVNNMA